ncbi:MAG: peptidoglycan DD-metalloendopeptidase family protein [Terricaulis sp.]
MRRAAPLLAAALAACASGHTAAPIQYGTAGASRSSPPARAETLPSRARQRAQTPAPQQQTQVQTQPADQAQDWADGPGTPLSQYALQPSEVHPYDPANMPHTHRVAPNQSLYDIASMYQLPLRALIDENHLQPPYALAPGTVLRLPPPNVHVVENGETFAMVAQRYNVDTRSLALLNRMQPPYDVHAGDRILLPAMARDMGASAPPPFGATLPPAVEQTSEAPLPRGNGHFAWPLRGQVVARFGVQASGARLDGIEIAGREGAPIQSAADGEVVYAGSDIPGYGTLVLVRHADNYVTAYGFARRALVHEGQRVRTGETIAELGARPSGGARLLFQVRRGTQAIDPAPLLGE